MGIFLKLWPCPLQTILRREDVTLLCSYLMGMHPLQCRNPWHLPSLLLGEVEWGEKKKILSWEKKPHSFGCPVCQLQMLRQMGILTTSFGAAKQRCVLWESLASSRVVSHHTVPGKMCYILICAVRTRTTHHFAQCAALCFNNTRQLSHQEKHPLCKTRGPNIDP